MPTHHKIKIQKTAHYYTLGQAGKEVTDFWIVCHGYGQLASRFIQKFTGIIDEQTFVLAPEGLSRFYWDGFGGDIVSSWMTSADRLDEIEDYTRFIKALYDEYRPQFAKNVRIHLLGFSQGCATQCRWVMQELPEFDNLILWAGLLPEDINYKAKEAYFKSKNLYFIYGKADPYLTSKRVDWLTHFAKAQGLEYETLTFEGKHTVDRGFLKTIAEKLQSRT